MSTFYKIKNKLSGNVIAIHGAAKTPAWLEEVAAKATDSDEQLWEFVPDPDGSGYSFIRSKLNGYVVDVNGAGTTPGTLLDSYPQKTTARANQLWGFYEDAKARGYCFIESQMNGDVIEVKHARKQPGGLLDVHPQKTKHNDHQLWTVVHGKFPAKPKELPTTLRWLNQGTGSGVASSGATECAFDVNLAISKDGTSRFWGSYTNRGDVPIITAPNPGRVEHRGPRRRELQGLPRQHRGRDRQCGVGVRSGGGRRGSGALGRRRPRRGRESRADRGNGGRPEAGAAVAARSPHRGSGLPRAARACDAAGGGERAHASPKPPMLFTEPAFLFLFLPVVLAAYFAVPSSWRNALLSAASFAFYAFGEYRFLPLMVLSIGLNYVLAIGIERTRGARWGRLVLAVGIASDLVLLLVFKYTNWLVADVDQVLRALHLRTLPVPSIFLPLGISFFTFHKISYKVDVYRGDTPAQRNALTLALYILFFPQLIAGPIVRYHDIADQLTRRPVRADGFAEGVRRFVLGLGKKMIVANTVAAVADAVFRLRPYELGPALAWLGIVSYAVQIYFDFSGYSDMAIGLALLFGFRFPENFDHPYASQSITEFWRRWHISLSRWFRDYLYIPLGGNRRGPARTYLNLLIVFVLCGAWHGASWEFIVWGLLHGSFLVLERLGLGALLERAPRLVRHAYTMLVVLVGWVFFRAGSLGGALGYLSAMFAVNHRTSFAYAPDLFLDPWVLTALAGGVVASFPVRGALASAMGPGPARELAAGMGLAVLFGASLLLIAAGTYNPFIYFRF